MHKRERERERLCSFVCLHLPEMRVKIDEVIELNEQVVQELHHCRRRRGDYQTSKSGADSRLEWSRVDSKGADSRVSE